MSKKRRGTRITFKQPSTTVNSLNEVTGAPEEYLTRWASIQNKSGSETSFGEQMQHVGSVEIETSYARNGRFPQPEDLVTWLEWGRTRTVQIKHVERLDDRGREIKLICAEV